jgi:hypothetical protein
MTATKNPQLKVTITREDGTVVTTTTGEWKALRLWAARWSRQGFTVSKEEVMPTTQDDTAALEAQAFDTALAALYLKAQQLRDDRARLINKLHFVAGDKKVGTYGKRVWAKTLEEVIALLKHERRGHDVIAELATVDAAHAALKAEIDVKNDIYAQAPWSRFILCLSHGGHIHNAIGCSTLHWDTPLEWHPELSGLTVEEAVKALGPTLCSVCFPSAPVEWRRKRSDVEREAKAGERAAKAEAKFIKNLRDSEIFPDYHQGRVTTVAGAKQALRDEVEFRDYFGHGKHPFHADSVKAAEQATKVLLARGVTQTEIHQIIERAIVKNRKDGANI